MAPPDWSAMFRFSVSPLEIAVRGSAIYWFLFLIFRTLVQRDLGSLGVSDVLVVVIVADAAQNAMAGDYKSIVDGMLLIAVIIGWSLLLDWLAFVSPVLRRLIKPRPLCLVRDGRIQLRALRRELISHDELWAKLRENGVADLAEVKLALMESDGSISVIRRPE